MVSDSSIILRIERYLKEKPPFSFFSAIDLNNLAKNASIAVYKANHSVFSKGEEPGPYFFLVKKGAVSIEEPQDQTAVLVDKCGEGDIFGIRPIMAESTYLFDATCLEDTIIYEIPVGIFREIYHKYPKAVDYMVQRFAAGRSMMMVASPAKSFTQTSTNLFIRPDQEKALVSTVADATVQEAIEIMSRHRVSSIIVLGENDNPAGIITDRDIRDFVASGYNARTTVKEIMSAPVQCVSPKVSLSEIQLVMIESGLHHLCVTESGTDETRCIGIVTEHDILYASASDPVVIIKKIKSARNLEALLDARSKIDLLVIGFLREDINRAITLSLIDQLNRALIKQVITICLSRYNQNNPTSVLTGEMFSFLTMGSCARGEQLLMTDQDHAIIIEDDYSDKRAEILILASNISEALQCIGYAFCPAKMMASNPEWCMTLSTFKKKVYEWVMVPGPEEVLMTSIFFDFRHEFGKLALAKELKFYLASMLKKQDVYIRFLAGQTVKNPPPLSFFRSFIIEKDGKHKDMFDIKLRGIAPLMDSARVLALDIPYLASTNTLDRFDVVKENDPGNAVLYDDAKDAFLQLLAIRLKTALTNNNNGRYLNPEDLDKIEKMTLRKCFEPGRRLLDMLERSYKLSYL